MDDSTSEAYQSLEADITGSLETLFCGAIPNCILTITGFKEGSVNVFFLISIYTFEERCGVEAIIISQKNNLQSNISDIPISSGNLLTGKQQLGFVAIVSRLPMYWKSVMEL